MAWLKFSAENVDEENSTAAEVHDIALQGLDYLDIRTDFWQQQKPMYSRKKDRSAKDEEGRRKGSASGKKDPTSWILKNLEEIDEGLLWYNWVYIFLEGL